MIGEEKKYYNNKNYPTLFKEMLLDAKSKGIFGLDDKVIEDIINGKNIEYVYGLFLSVYSKILSEYYLDAEEIYESNDLRLAKNKDLDVIGFKLGLMRYPATKSITTLQFSTTDELEESLYFNRGIEVTGTNKEVYVTTEGFTFDQNKKTVTVDAESKSEGSKSHVKKGEITTLITDLRNIDNISVVNIIPSYGGADQEADDHYRLRLSNWRSITQRGNEYAYRNVLDNMDGLGDYTIIPKWDGAGTVKIITIPGTASIRNKVYETLQENAALFDEDLTIVGAKEYPINITCDIYVKYDIINQYSLSEEENIKTRTELGIKEYVSQLKIGEDFIPFQCAVYINSNIPRIKDIQFQKPSSPVVVDEESVITLKDVSIKIN